MKYSLLILLGVFISFSLYSKSMFVTKDSGLFLDIYGKVWSIDADKEQPQPMNALKDTTIRQVVSNGYSTFFISQEGQVFVTGNNRDGQLGLGNIHQVFTPQRITFEDGVAIRQVVSNGFSTFFISEEGQVFATGRNVNGQLGLGHCDPIDTPQRVTFEDGVVIRQVVSSDCSTFFISEEGQVFATGSNGLGRLGLGDTGGVNTPRRVTSLDGVAIRRVVSSGGSTFFVSEEGQVFATGNNGLGRLGLGNVDDVSTPRRVTFEVGVTIRQVISNYGSTFFISQEGQVFATGSNVNGWLGLGNIGQVTTPQRVAFEDGVTIRQVISSGCSTFFISDAGQVFATGNNRDGEFGLGHNTPVVTPTRVLMPLNSPITQVEVHYKLDGCGTFFLDESGEVYFAGKTFPWVKKILSSPGVAVDSRVITPSKLELPFQVMQSETKQSKRIKGAHTLLPKKSLPVNMALYLSPKSG